jgi:stage IV sporulation protein A
MDCREVNAEMAEKILDSELKRFPVEQVNIDLPKWVDTLEEGHPLRVSLAESAKQLCDSLDGLDAVEESAKCLEENENVNKCYVGNIDSSTGVVDIELTLNGDLFYNILSETTGMPIGGEYDLISTIKGLSEAKSEYDKIKYALMDVQRTGYGVVAPPIEDMALEKPELMKQGNRYGIALKATAPTIHLIRADVTTSVAPIVGTEEQSKELVAYLNSRYSLNKEDIWEYNIFGKTMGELINDDLSSKLARLPEDTQNKFRMTVEKILNEGSGGVICILL